MAMTHRTMIGALCLGLSLAACNRDRDADVVREAPGDVPATMTPTAALAVTDLKVGNALGTDGQVVEAGDEFAPTDTIYAVVSTSGAAAATGSTLTARWTFEDGQVVDETSRDIAPTGNAITEFHVAKASDWPEGQYKVSILLDGRTVSEQDFTVKR